MSVNYSGISQNSEKLRKWAFFSINKAQDASASTKPMRVHFINSSSDCKRKL